MNATLCQQDRPVQRGLGIVFGVGTQVFFLVTVWHLFWFLNNGRPGHLRGPLWVDALLAIQFAAPHSLLLLPAMRKFLGRWISGEFYPLFYCSLTCVNLLITIGCWRTSERVVWQLSGVPGLLLQAGFYASWIALIYSLNLSGFGSQTGLPQWWQWVRHRAAPRPEFKPRGAYLWLRHPVYLSFAGLIWFTPTMTLDHALLTGIWTMYILSGGYLKDLRMAYYLGDRYRDYQKQVPAFPFLPCGRQGRLRDAKRSAISTSERSRAAAGQDAA